MVGVYRVYPKRKKSFLNFKVNITLVLILINLFFFILMFPLGFFKNECELTICKYIALKPSNILQGNSFWTFLTSMFMHGGFFHIFANMLSLFFIGSLIERILGAKRYLYFYLISGLFAGLFFILSSLLFSGDLSMYAVGASGALFGLIGLLMLLTPNLRVYLMFIPIPIKIKYAAPGILIVLWLISIAGDVPIGNTAHLGGLIFGLIYGLYLRKKYPRKIKMLNAQFS